MGEQPSDGGESPAQIGPRERARRARQREVVDPRPFAERYRGTEWDTAPPADTPEGELSLRRRRLTWPVVAGITLVAVAVLVTVLFVMIGRAPSGMNAFRMLTPAPTSTQARSSPTPASAATPGPPTQSLPPQPWRADPAHPATRFIANMTSTSFTYHLAADVAMVGQSEMASLEFDLAVAGADYQLDLELTTRTSRRKVELIVEGGQFSGRIDGGRWVTGSGRPPPANVFGPLREDSYERLEYVGAERYRRLNLYHLRMPAGGWPGPLDRAVVVVAAPAASAWDVWVDDLGRPRFAELTMPATVGLDGREVALTIDFDYRFSRFNRPAAIGAE